MLLLLAFPQSWDPLFQMGLWVELWSRSLGSRHRGDREFIIQCRLLALNLRCTFLHSMCFLRVGRLLRWTPRYVASLAWGICKLFKVKRYMLFIICSLILIRQSDSHFSTATRWTASWFVAIVGHLERLRIAVSSANVDVISLSFVGTSVYRNAEL